MKIFLNHAYAAALTIGFVAASLVCRAAEPPKSFVIHAGRLIDVRGEKVLTDRSIWIEGDPLQDISELEHVKFVMKAGEIVRDDAIMK